MNPDVVTVPSDLPLSEVADLFKERCISGAPVVDDTGLVLGVVSQTDLMLAHRTESDGVARFQVEPEGLGVTVTEVGAASAESVMTPGAIAIDENTTVAEAAKAMLDRHIHRVLVTRDGKLAGIITTMDLLRVLAGTARPAPRKAAARKKTPARKHGKTARRR
ncbi:MAG: CBS domain-containing protein [Elusimicrobia bacterium]|nr:CBS domain-containing protein [Elusimicrobiota bacterium]